MTKAISAMQTYPKAQPLTGMDLVDFDVAVAAEGGPVTICVMAHDPQHAMDKVNGMPPAQLTEAIEFERAIARQVARVVHGR